MEMGSEGRKSNTKRDSRSLDAGLRRRETAARSAEETEVGRWGQTHQVVSQYPVPLLLADEKVERGMVGRGLVLGDRVGLEVRAHVLRRRSEHRPGHLLHEDLIFLLDLPLAVDLGPVRLAVVPVHLVNLDKRVVPGPQHGPGVDDGLVMSLQSNAVLLALQLLTCRKMDISTCGPFLH